MKDYIFIGLGSAIGGMLRYFIGSRLVEKAGESFPWATLFVNVTGCFLIGIFTVLCNSENHFLSDIHFRKFLLVGLFGGYTTFSTFSLQTLQLIQQHQRFRLPAEIEQPSG